MGPEKQKQEQEQNNDKPAAQPDREDQTGMAQASQSLWETKEGKAIAPPPDAVPKADPKRKK